MWRLRVPLLTLIARLAFSAQQWAVIAILALSKEDQDLGLFGLALALVTSVNALFNFGMRQGVATDIGHNRSILGYATLRILTIAVSICIIPGVSVIFWDAPGLTPMIFSVLLVKSVDLLSEFSYGLMQLHGQNLCVAISQVLRAASGIIGFVAAYEVSESVSLATVAWGGAWFFVWLAYDLPASRMVDDIRKTWGTVFASELRIELWKLTKMQFPFGLAALAGNIGLAAPRIFLEYSSDLKTLGVFTALWSVFQAVEAFVIAILNIYLTPLARVMRIGDIKSIFALISGLFATGVAASFVGMIITKMYGSEILRVLYGSGYAEYAEVFFALSLGWSARYLADVVRFAVTAKRQFWTGAVLDSLGSAYTVLACLLLAGSAKPMSAVCNAFILGQTLLLITLMAYFTWELHRMKSDVSL